MGMVLVGFSSVYSYWPWFRQTPGGTGQWPPLHVVLNPELGAADWLVVYEEAEDKLPTLVPRERRILFMMEPPLLKRYKASYLNQFGIIVCPMPRRPEFRGVWLRQQAAQMWYYGVNERAADKSLTALPWETLLNPPTEKTRELSVVCSMQKVTAEHRLRLDFVEKLIGHFGSRLDVFGRGRCELGDKAEALAPYRYHIALENNTIDHFWSEKLSDPLLANCYTFHFGCANIGDYFAPGGITQIDIREPDRAIAEIERVIAAQLWEKSLPAIAANRKRLMEEHNFFAVLARVVTGALPSAQHVSPLRKPALIRAPHFSGLRNQLHWKALFLRNRVRDYFRGTKTT